MLCAANDHDVPSLDVDGDHAVIVDELHLTGSRPQKVRFVPVVDVPGPEVLELLPGCGRIHSDLAARLALPIPKSEGEQMIGYVVFIGGVELHAEIGQSVRRIIGSQGGHAPRMSAAPEAPASTRESGASPESFGE